MAVNESIVREYFELHEFLVRQYRKYVGAALREDDDLDFLVHNPKAQPPRGELPFVLTSEDLPLVERALIVIKPWHSEVFSPALLNNSPELFRFLEQRAFQQAALEFGRSGRLLKIMVVSALPKDAQARAQSTALLRDKGIDAVIAYRTMVADLVGHVSPNRNYQKSELLQTLRILKAYDFLKSPQMELFKARPRTSKTARR